MAAAVARMSPWSADCSAMLRTRMKRPGISSRCSMACRASAISHGKILQGADFQGHRVALIDLGCRRPVAQHPGPVFRQGDESPAVPLVRQPFEVFEVGGSRLGQASHEVFEFPCLGGLAVDGLRTSEAVDHL